MLFNVGDRNAGYDGLPRLKEASPGGLYTRLMPGTDIAKPTYWRNHSYRSASIGSRRDARWAG